MNDIMSNLGSAQNSNTEDLLTPFLSSPNLKKLLEVLVIQTFDRILKPTLENSIRKVVKHELELAEKRFLVAKRNPEKDIPTPKPRSLKLKFLTKVSVPVLTGVEIKGEGGIAIEVALVDDISGEIIDSGSEAFSKVEVVVLKGDFGDEGGDTWTSEEFCRNIVRDREANKSLLAETVHLKLNKGIGVIDKIRFTHSARYMRSNVFRLGARFIDSFNGTQVKEATTEPFTLKDMRQLYHEKHDPPSLSDGVQRLKNIGRGGKNRLRDENVHTVEDFLILLLRDPERLKSVLNLKPTMWGETMSHAKRCIISDRMYCYTDTQQNAGVVFNIVGKVLGLVLECQYLPMHILSESDKANAQRMLVSACQDWHHVVAFDDKTSFLQYLSQLSSSMNHSISPGQEGPNNNNDVESSRMNGSFQAIFSSISPARTSGAISLHECGSTSIRNMEISNSPIYSPGIQDLWFDDANIRFEDLMLGFHSHRQSATTTNLTFVPPHDGSISKVHVQNRWKMLLSILRRSSIRRRAAALTDVHVHKKQKIF